MPDVMSYASVRRKLLPENPYFSQDLIKLREELGIPEIIGRIRFHEQLLAGQAFMAVIAVYWKLTRRRVSWYTRCHQ